MAHSIWIPSRQQFRQFTNITTQQQLDLAKTIELDITKTSYDFELQLISTLQQLTVDRLQISELSILDKLTIILQLALNGVGNARQLTMACDKCKTSTLNNISVSKIVQQLQKYLDKDYRTTIKHRIGEQTIAVAFDVLPIKNRLRFNQLLLEHPIKLVQDVELLSWITSIKITNGRQSQVVDINTLSFQQMRDVMGQLPLPLVRKLNDQAVVHSKEHLLATLRCGNCEHSQPIMFTLGSVDSMINTLLKLNAASIYSEVFELKHLQLIGSIEDGMKLTPIERVVYLKLHQSASAKSASNSTDRK